MHTHTQTYRHLMVHVQAPQFSQGPLFQHQTHIEGGHIPNGETIATVNVLGGFKVSNVVSVVQLLHNPNQTVRSPSRFYRHQTRGTVVTSILFCCPRKCRKRCYCMVCSTLSLMDSGKWLANQWSAWRFQAWRVWSSRATVWKRCP